MKPSLPSWISPVLLALLLAANLFTWVQLGDLEQQLDTVNSRLWQMEERLNDNISSIYQEVSSQLEAEASLLAQADWPQAGDPDPVSLTVPLTLTFTPKAVTASTQAVIRYGEEEVPCTREGNRFTAVLSVPLWGEVDPSQGSILLEEGGVTQANPFPDEWWFSPRGEILPTFYGGGGSGSFGSNNGTFSIHMDFDMNINSPAGRTLSNSRCLILVDGQLWKEQPAELDPSAAASEEDWYNTWTTFALNEEIPMEDGQGEVEILFSVTDDLGLEYRYTLQHVAPQEDGDIQDLGSTSLAIYRAGETVPVYEE